MVKVFGVGRLGRDAELRHLQSGEAVLNFSVACDGQKKGNEKTTTWLNCALWGKRAESLAPRLTKGTSVGISGTLSEREYTTKSGEVRRDLECRVDDVTFAGSKPQNGADYERRSYGTSGQGASAKHAVDVRPEHFSAGPDEGVPF